MKKSLALIIIATAAFMLFQCPPIQASSKEVERVEAATEILAKIMSIPETAIPPSLLKNAYGVAVIPSVIKAGFVVGGRYGRGILAVRSENNRWSNPAFISFTGGSIGFQIGAQSSDIILVFKSRKSVFAIKKGKFTLGADASVAAGPVGRHAEAATDIQLRAEIYSYSRSRGLFAGVSLEGSALQMDSEANTAFYNQANIPVDDILSNKGIHAPISAKQFSQTLFKYTQ